MCLSCKDETTSHISIAWVDRQAGNTSSIIKFSTETIRHTKIRKGGKSKNFRISNFNHECGFACFDNHDKNLLRRNTRWLKINDRHVVLLIIYLLTHKKCPKHTKFSSCQCSREEHGLNLLISPWSHSFFS